MAQRVLAISLGSEIVKVCEVSLAGKKKVQVYNAIDLLVPSGLCEDGVIQNVDALASAIKQGLNGEGFTSKKIVFSIASKRIASKEAVIPFCKENMIQNLVNINASEYFPIANLDDYVFNYSVIEVIQNDNVKNYRLSVIATPKDLIRDYYALASAMGMSVVTIDYSGNSILQLLKLQTGTGEVDAILQMGSESTVVNIMDGPVMVMQRNVPYGRTTIEEAVENARGVGENLADMILVEEDINDLIQENEGIAESVRSLFSGINRIIEFYTSRHQDKPIENIFMIGDVVSVNGLVDLFDREWDYNVSMIESLAGIEIKNRKNVTDEIASNYLANIGAVLAPINLRVEDEKESKKKKGGLPWWILILSILCAGVMVGGVLYLHHDKKKEVESIQKRIDALGVVDDLEIQYKTAMENKASVEFWYDSTKSNNETLAKFIDDLETVQPSDVAITQFSASNGDVSINATSLGKEPVAEFVIQLKKLPYVSDVNAIYISEATSDFVNVDTFNITLKLLYDDPYNEDTEESEEGDVGGNGESADDVVYEDTSNDQIEVEYIDGSIQAEEEYTFSIVNDNNHGEGIA